MVTLDAPPITLHVTSPDQNNAMSLMVWNMAATLQASLVCLQTGDTDGFMRASAVLAECVATTRRWIQEGKQTRH